MFVPKNHADSIRTTLSSYGAGKIGAYDSCSFSSVGTGRFRPLKGSSPAVGTEGAIEEVEEERIEAIVSQETNMSQLLQEIKRVHPYEEPAIFVLPVVDYHDFLQ